MSSLDGQRHLAKRLGTAALASCAVMALGAAEVAHARKQRMVACVLDAPGSARVAGPYLDKLLRAIEGAMSWSEGTLSGTYTPRRKKCLRELKKKTTTLAVLSVETFVAQRKRLRLQPLAVTEMSGRAATKYHVVVKKGAAQSLAALKDAKFMTSHGADARFLAKVVFAGALGPTVSVRRTNAPLRALRAVHKGDVAATVLDDDELEKMKALPFADELVVVHTSPALPNPVVARVGKRGGDALDGLGQKLMTLCQGEHKATCEGMRFTGFGALDSASLDALSDAYR